jgi:V8-like Glu-specific endopeptidase
MRRSSGLAKATQADRKTSINSTKVSAVSDDGTPLMPVNGRSQIGDLEIIPIESPPFPSSRPRRNTKGPSRKAETTSTPKEANDSPTVKQKPDPQREEQLRGKDEGPVVDNTRQIFGTDSRVLVTPTNIFPNRAICRLIVTYPLTPAGKAFAGTGSLIGDRHVLTAGHVLFNAAQGGWAQRIRVVPGMDGDTWWFDSELLVWPNFRQRSVTGWSEDQDIDYDYGLITLNTGFSLGSFGLLYASDSTLDNTTAYITGYPAEKGTPAGTQQFGVPGGGGITDYDSTLVYYKIDTSKGQSGSGVYRFWEGKRAIIAVHGGQYDGDENRGARITKDRYNRIRGWQSADLGLL